MMQTLYIHPQNPQDRLINQVVSALKADKLIVLPTDIGYAFGARLNAKTALDTLQKLTVQQDNSFAKLPFVLLCQDLSQVAQFTQINNTQFSVLKKTPLQTVFILNASKNTPKKLVCPKQKTLGVCFTNQPIALALLACLNEPIVINPILLDEPYLIDEQFDKFGEYLIDVGYLASLPFDVSDLHDKN